MKADMNLRGLDPTLYRNFKSAVYKAGFNNIKGCMETLMTRFIEETQDSEDFNNTSSDTHNTNIIS